MLAGHQLFQTKCRCRMLSGSETQTQIKHHNALTCSWFTLAPAWLHQQCLTEFQWLEVFFPRLGPVLTADFSDRDSASINAPAALPDLSQAAAQPNAYFSLGTRPFRPIDRNRGSLRLRVSVNRRRFCEYAFEKCGDGLFRLSGSGHGDLPDGATRHDANSSIVVTGHCRPRPKRLFELGKAAECLLCHTPAWRQAGSR